MGRLLEIFLQSITEIAEIDHLAAMVECFLNYPSQKNSQPALEKTSKRIAKP